MKVSFAIHGTPGKSECWGMTDDEEYLKSFYNAVGSVEENAFIDIDLRMVEGTVCSYYHYLHLKNVTNNSKRPGGYIGISIRFDGAYCTDARNLYRMLDGLYKQVVCKSILQVDGNNVTYKYASFKQCQSELEKIQGMAIKALEQFANDLRVFPQNYSPKHSNDTIRKYNIEDSGSESFHNVLLEKAEVHISDEYPSINAQITDLEKANASKKELLNEQRNKLEQQSNDISALNGKVKQQAQEINNQKEVINNQNQDLSEKEQTNHNLNQALKEAGQKITELINKNNDLQEKIKNAITEQDRKTLEKCLSHLTTIAQKQGEIIQLTNGCNIESEISKLQQQLSNIGLPLKPKKETPSSNHEDTADVSNDDRSGFLKKNGKLWKTLVAVTIPILIIISISYGLWNADRQIDNLFMTQQILHNDIQNIEMRLDTLENRRKTPPDPPKQIETPTVPKITWINIRETQTGKVEVGKWYTLEAQTGSPGSRVTVDCGGYFTANPSNLIRNNNGETCKLNVPSTYNKDKITIYYVVNGEQVINRAIPINK